MALKRSASMLLVSMMVLHWATSLAWSDHLTSALSNQLAPGTKVKTEKALNAAKESLSLLSNIMGSTDTQQLSTVMKGISSFASLAPGVGPLVFSVINLILAFIPEEDPVLNEVKKGFAEVNQKLDSLSNQISKLATDVEWYSYVSVYSRDELNILNAWKKFDEFLNKAESQSDDETRKIINIFSSYYESTGVESSVYNLYRYLTVDSTSLSENLNTLLKEKFKCDVYMMSRYNVYLSSLFWKGMVLNQFYWKLIGIKKTDKEGEIVQMFKKVSEGQLAAVEFCLENYKEYLKEDVKEIINRLSPDNKAVAERVKEALDNKYRWYNWVVVVFNCQQLKNHQVYTEFQFSTNSLVVAVDHTVKADMIHVEQVKNTIKECFQNKRCEIKTTIERCTRQWYVKDLGEQVTFPFEKYAVVTQVAYNRDFAEVPAPFYRVQCSWDGYYSWVSFHYSRTLKVCATNQCKNNGICKRLLLSNEWLCECQEGYTGDTCEKQINTIVTVPNSSVWSTRQNFLIALITGISISIILLIVVAIVIQQRCKSSLCCRSRLESENVVDTGVSTTDPCRDQGRAGVFQMREFCKIKEVRSEKTSFKVSSSYSNAALQLSTELGITSGNSQSSVWENKFIE